jgi:hypothetical protein
MEFQGAFKIQQIFRRVYVQTLNAHYYECFIDTKDSKVLVALADARANDLSKVNSLEANNRKGKEVKRFKETPLNEESVNIAFPETKVQSSILPKGPVLHTVSSLARGTKVPKDTQIEAPAYQCEPTPTDVESILKNNTLYKDKEVIDVPHGSPDLQELPDSHSPSDSQPPSDSLKRHESPLLGNEFDPLFEHGSFVTDLNTLERVNVLEAELKETRQQLQDTCKRLEQTEKHIDQMILKSNVSVAIYLVAIPTNLIIIYTRLISVD